MQFGRQLSDRELLGRLSQATLELDQTSAHARRSIRAARRRLLELQRTKVPPLRETEQKQAS